MEGLNLVVIMGRCGRYAPKCAEGQYGKYAFFTMEVPRKFTNYKTGETKEFTDFITIKAEKAVATVVENFVKPGTPLLVHGRLRIRFEADKDDPQGKKHEKHEVVASEIVLCGTANDSIAPMQPMQTMQTVQQGFDDFPVENGEFRFDGWN